MDIDWSVISTKKFIGCLDIQSIGYHSTDPSFLCKLGYTYEFRKYQHFSFFKAKETLFFLLTLEFAFLFGLSTLTDIILYEYFWLVQVILVSSLNEAGFKLCNGFHCVPRLQSYAITFSKDVIYNTFQMHHIKYYISII